MIATALLGTAPLRASAVFTYSIQSVVSASPGTGSFEVDLTNNSGAAAVVDSFDFGLSMPNASFTFTSARCDTTLNTYIFAPPATNSIACPAINGNALPDTILNAGDVWGGTGAGVSVADGATVALGEVFFSIAGGVTPGPYVVSFIPADDSMATVTGALIGPIDDSGTGTITIAAPEPTTMALLGLTLLPLFWAKRRGRA